MNPVAQTLRREARVAFSRHAQPVWFRIAKWLVILTLIALYHDARWFWPAVGGALLLGLAVHFFYRWQTRSWTRAWGGWNDLAAGRN